MSVQEKQSKWSPVIWVLCLGRQLIFMVWDNQFDFNLRIDMNCLKMLSKEHIFKVSNGTRSSFSWRTLEKWEERREERPWTGRRKSAVCWSSYSLELVNRLSCRQLQNKGRDTDGGRGRCMLHMPWRANQWPVWTNSVSRTLRTTESEARPAAISVPTSTLRHARNVARHQTILKRLCISCQTRLLCRISCPASELCSFF